MIDHTNDQGNKDSLQIYLVEAGHVPVANISQVGVSLQTQHPLIIGQKYALYMWTDEHSLIINGMVVRCRLSELAETLDGHREPLYQNGIEFEINRNPKEERLMGIIQDNIYGEKRLGSARVTPIKPLYADVCRPCFQSVYRMTTSTLLIESRELLDMDEEWTLLMRFEEECVCLKARIHQASKKDGCDTYEILFEYVEPALQTVDFIGRVLQNRKDTKQ